MAAAKQILIGGGSGFIGKRLTKLLTFKGYNVSIISRMPGHDRLTWHDLDEKGLPENTHAVINLAGQNVLDPTRRWTPGFKQNVWNSRCNTSATLSKAITNATTKPSIFINVSGVSLYKPDPKKIYTESDAGESFDFMSRLCLEWEKAATLPTNIETKLIRIRSGVVIGREGGMIQSMYLPFWLGLGGPIGDGKQPLPWIHIIDLCELIYYCIEMKDIKSGPINGVAPEIVTNGEFSKQFASTLCRPAVFSVPEFAVNLIFGKERAALLTTGAQIKPERAEQIGFAYRYRNIRDACHEVVYHA